jgi:hypothetical protein
LRLESIVTGKKNLEHLYSFKDFPVFMGCVDSPADDDLFADMDWAIDPETGIIQLEKLLPLEALYMNQHCDGTGKIWQDHYTAFTKFLHKFSPKNVLEIGGAHDHIARNYRALDAHISWTIIEPNPEHIEDTRTKVIKAWFDNTFAIEGHFDTVIHSHVVEHAYNPLLFIEHISKFMGKSDRHIFSFPLLLPMFKLKWTNCLNFEHTVFLTEEIIEYILKKFGFIVLEKEYYGNPHSVFYATEKADVPVFIPPMDNKYVEYRKIFMDFIDFHKEMAADLNRKIESASEPVYLFGAHIFSEFLIQFGLRTEKIVSVLDNSRFKIGRRLYGTNFFVESPAVLKNKGPANVILKAGGYNEEIKKDILENINHEVKFW